MTTQAITKATQNFIFRTPQGVYCPCCAAAITQRTFMVKRSIVWCIRCGELRIDNTDWLYIACHWTGLATQWVKVRGLRFWTPGDPLDGIVTHYCKDREIQRVVLPPYETIAEDPLTPHDRGVLDSYPDYPS